MFEGFLKRARPDSIAGEPPGLRIDIGCGNNKKPGTLGLDHAAGPGVDHVLDLDTQPLPFEDRSVAYVHSSHFLEHSRDPVRILSEIGRVCCHGAHLELWTPYGSSNEALIYDHKTFFVEDHYLHPCLLYPDYWEPILRGRWILDELQFVIPRNTVYGLRLRGIGVRFGLTHLRNVATEFCARITVLRDKPFPVAGRVQRTFTYQREQQRRWSL